MNSFKSFILIISLINIVSASDEIDGKIGFQYSLQFQSRENFQQNFGSLNYFGGSISIIIDQRSDLQFSISFTMEESSSLDDLELSATPISIFYNYYFRSDKIVSYYLAGGPSYYFCKLEHLDDGKRNEQKYGGFGLAVGCGMVFQYQILFGNIGLYYTHSFVGDPDLGNPGNIGGLNLVLGISIGV